MFAPIPIDDLLNKVKLVSNPDLRRDLIGRIFLLFVTMRQDGADAVYSKKAKEYTRKKICERIAEIKEEHLRITIRAALTVALLKISLGLS